ncbi:unnamed protein product [Triticum turgidum subsp. durum]|uniref:MULE transposase domain-containing protein n=1 Tax=Triticum turgidum subsp. durum TaxID=4567 RepID=A0A9R0XUF1_TRITD|nr:unnamed protein product [Triticum turgidum subsp. durum]
MYSVAWAVVETKTNESWVWFIGLLIKDLDINDQGAGWVFISDKQKVKFIYCLIQLLKRFSRVDGAA